MNEATQQTQLVFTPEIFQNVAIGSIVLLLFIIAFAVVSINGKLK